MTDRGICLEISLISVLATIVTTSGIVYSLQGMFFPHEAESKGANPFDYGLIFAIYELVILIASPIIGSQIHLLHLKTTILIGMALCGSTAILFGLTYKLEGTWVFLLSCAILRVCEAIGASSILMGSIVFIATEFPHSIAMYSGIIETGFTLGTGIGPLVGAPLFQLGGFKTPFLCVGGFILTLILLPLFIISNEGKSGSDSGEVPVRGFGFFQLFRTPAVLVYAGNTVLVGMGFTFILSMLEPYVRMFGMTENELSLLFLAMNGVHALTTPIFGWIVDRMVRPGLLVLFGLCIIAIGFLFIGPATFIPLRPKTVWTTVGLMLVGLGQGAFSMSSFLEMIHESERAGFTDELSRSGLVSGLTLSCYCLGGFVGPTLGGLLVTHFGFQAATDVFFILYVILATILALFLRQRVTHHVPFK